MRSLPFPFPPFFLFSWGRGQSLPLGLRGEDDGSMVPPLFVRFIPGEAKAPSSFLPLFFSLRGQMVLVRADLFSPVRGENAQVSFLVSGDELLFFFLFHAESRSFFFLSLRVQIR